MGWSTGQKVVRDPDRVVWLEHRTRAFVIVSGLWPTACPGSRLISFRSGRGRRASSKTFWIHAVLFLCGLTAARGAQLRLTWTDNSPNETGFVIERAVATGEFQVVATMPSDSTEYLDQNLLDGTTYRYRLKAFNEVGSSDYTAVVTAQTAAAVVPTPTPTPTPTPEVSKDGASSTPPPETVAEIPLSITSQPADTVVVSNASATLQVVAVGSGAIAYQWYRGDRGTTSVPITGANAATFVTPPLTESTRYWVRVYTASSSFSSQTATVSVLPLQRTYFGTLFGPTGGTAFAAHLRSDQTLVLVADFPGVAGGIFVRRVAVGADRRFAIDTPGAGPLIGEVSAEQVSGVTSAGYRFVATSEITGISTPALEGLYEGAVLGSANESFLVLAGSVGHACVISNQSGVTQGAILTLTGEGLATGQLRDGRAVSLALHADSLRFDGMIGGSAVVGLHEGLAADSRLVNLSVRAGIHNSEVLIFGFSISGEGSKSLLLRAVGPTLGQFGVPDPLADPLLTLYRQAAAGAAVVTGNDNWNADSSSSVPGAFPLPAGSRDAALSVQLAAGGYTAHVASADASGGTALIELYDGARIGSARLSNVSLRTELTTPNDFLITGFAIDGNAPKRVLVRAVGRELDAFGVPRAMMDPVMTIYRSNGSASDLVGSNDNWSSEQAEITAASANTGTFPLSATSQSAAKVAWLAPGAYTVVVQGRNGSTGAVLIELYEVPN